VPSKTVSSSQQPSGGLYLDGTVVSTDTQHKSWEGKEYDQIKIGVSDGRTTYNVVHRLGDDKQKDEAFSALRFLARIRVRVTRATTEKGQINVGGELC